MAETLQMPPFSSVLKSREVEDPINVMVHRPLAYGFCWALFRTPLTPNMVTLLAIVAGVLAGTMFVFGTATAMVAGGILLWASAILDGADGIMARAKKMSSEYGRALDGAADSIVAVATVFPAFYHIWVTTHDPIYMLVMVPTIVSALVHITTYDYYKESYLRQTRLDKGGEGADLHVVENMVQQARSRGMLTYLAVKHALLPQATAQHKIIGLIDPDALREGVAIRPTKQSADIYRRHNVGPMRVWAMISLAPHSYLMAICAMLDLLHVYVWIRLVFMNIAFFGAIAWQRQATALTNAELNGIGARRELDIPDRTTLAA